MTIDVTDPVFFAQGIADLTGHATALLERVPPHLVDQTVFFQVFEQDPNPQASPTMP